MEKFKDMLRSGTQRPDELEAFAPLLAEGLHHLDAGYDFGEVGRNLRDALAQGLGVLLHLFPEVGEEEVDDGQSHEADERELRREEDQRTGYEEQREHVDATQIITVVTIACKDETSVRMFDMSLPSGIPGRSGAKALADA
jgi:hypothetical protein